MVKAVSAILLLGLVVVANTVPLRQRFVPRRGLAHQEQAALPNATPTGYPMAGVTPDIPFDLPSSTAQPEVSYLPPDNEYGPPGDEAAQPEEPDDIPAPVDDEVNRQQPVEDEDVPEDQDEVLVQINDDGTVIAVSTTLDQPQDSSSSKSARIYQRFPQARRRQQQQPIPQRLVLLKL